MHRAHGKGLSGFIFGLLCATAAIMGVLYFLNHTSSGLRQDVQTKPPEIPPVEIVRPRGAGAPLPDAGATSNALAPLEVEPSVSVPTQANHQSGHTASDVAHYHAASEPKSPPKPASTPSRKPVVTTVKPTAEQILNSGSIEKANEEVARAQTQRNEAQRSARSTPKPTAEQILNSGSIEKANEEVARRQATQQSAGTSRDTAGTQSNRNNTAASGSRNVVQAGAFGSEAAAKSRQQQLNSMGIRTQIQSYTVNGQRLYAVRSARMSREEAQALANRWREQGVDAIVK